MMRIIRSLLTRRPLGPRNPTVFKLRVPKVSLWAAAAAWSQHLLKALLQGAMLRTLRSPSLMLCP